MPIEMVTADHQNKPDVGSSIARKWYRRRQRRRDRRCPELGGGAGRRRRSRADKNKVVHRLRRRGTSDLTGEGLHAQHHPLDLRHLGAGQRHRQRGGEGRRRHLVLPHRRLCVRPGAGAGHRARWSRRTAARCWARCATRSTPPDFSSFLLQAQASKAKIIGLANAGGDTINSIKAAAEFGIVKGGQKLAGLLVLHHRRARARAADRAGPAC